MPTRQARKRTKKRGSKKAPASLKVQKSTTPEAGGSIAPKNPRRNTKRRAAAVALLVLLVLLFSPFLHHLLMPSTRLNIAVVDKTVGSQYREHYSLFWILNHNKIVPGRSGQGTADPDGDGKYTYTTDYYGFHPLSNSTISIMNINLDPSIVDVLYLADTYGAAETYGVTARQGNYAAGITAPEAAAIDQFAKKGGSIYAEWNVLGDPTYGDAVAEATMSRVLHATYMGYGSFFGNLSSVNQIVKDLYYGAAGSTWNFNGPGVVIILDSPSYVHAKVIVLNGDDISDERSPVKFEPATPSQITGGVVWDRNFGYWFEVLKPYSDVQALATFRLSTTQSGSAKLAMYGLGTTFPALLQYSGSYKVLYCAADCTDYPGGYPQYAWVGISGVDLFFKYAPQSSLFGELTSRQVFFWKIFYPIMTEGLKWLGVHGNTSVTRFVDPFSDTLLFVVGTAAFRKRVV